VLEHQVGKPDPQRAELGQPTLDLAGYEVKAPRAGLQYQLVLCPHGPNGIGEGAPPSLC